MKPTDAKKATKAAFNFARWAEKARGFHKGQFAGTINNRPDKLANNYQVAIAAAYEVSHGTDASTREAFGLPSSSTVKTARRKCSSATGNEYFAAAKRALVHNWMIEHQSKP